MRRREKWPREIRIAAAADYLVGKPTKQITAKHGPSAATVCYWIRLAGFKSRTAKRGGNHHPTIVRRLAQNSKRDEQLAKIVR